MKEASAAEHGSGRVEEGTRRPRTNLPEVRVVASHIGDGQSRCASSSGKDVFLLIFMEVRRKKVRDMASSFPFVSSFVYDDIKRQNIEEITEK